MKKVFKILGIILGVVLFAVTVLLIYFYSTYPKVNPPSEEKVEFTSERIARGDYLANHVAVCMDCHSTRDWSKFSGPIKQNTLGKGGDKFDKDMGFPGVVYVKNITPAALNNWTDGEIIRAVTCGIDKYGNALFPMMPYPNYNKLSKEDLYSIVAYIRSIPAINNHVADRSLDFPLNIIVRMMPIENYSPAPEPNKSDAVEYGKYLTTIAGCMDCHTPWIGNERDLNKSFAGGAEFFFPGGTVRSVNLTPDDVTGIGKWTLEQFIGKFRAFDSDSNLPATAMNDFNTPMPWTMYAKITDEDLTAMFTYLKSLSPINNSVVRWSPKQ